MGDGDGCRYFGVGVSLGLLIAARKSLRRLFTIILIVRVLPIFLDILRITFCFFIGKV